MNQPVQPAFETVVAKFIHYALTRIMQVAIASDIPMERLEALVTQEVASYFAADSEGEHS